MINERSSSSILRLAAQWLERLTGHQKVAGSIPVWGSEIVFLRTELDERSSVIPKDTSVRSLRLIRTWFSQPQSITCLNVKNFISLSLLS